MSTVKEARPCPSCGQPMLAGALAGLCPACLLAQGADTRHGEADAGARFEPPPLAEVAKLFPQLEILDLLGAGGMGAVYKARQPALDRVVALKTLPSQNARGVNFAERFNREARALARLSHPNIVAVHEFGQAGALSYFIMEYVDGANLRLLEQGSRLSPREALQIIPQICDALQYAHDEGVVHRDIKPENVLVDRKGRVKIADFGLAKILGHDPEAARLTAEGQVMGTPHYMAPEQVEKPLAVDHRADIYALGVVFYEMLTGDLPLGKFPPPSRKVQVDVRFDEVVLRALENDPARRYQKASEVKSQVETIAGTPAAAPSAQPPTKQFIRRAGFPLVMARDGARAIHWKGVAYALALTFGFFTLAFGLVSMVVGRSLLGWIGVVGWPSLVARLALSIIAVGWMVRWALRCKGEPESRRTPDVTAILPTEGFSRKAITGAIGVPIFLIAAPLSYLLLPNIIPAGRIVSDMQGWLAALVVGIALAGLAAPFVTTILGWLAVTDIRRRKGRVAGLPLAVFDGLIFPLLLLDAAIFSASVNGFGLFRRPLGTEVVEILRSSNLDTLGALAICALVDFLIVRRVWRAVRSARSFAEAEAEWWWSHKRGAITILALCLLVLTFVAERRSEPAGFTRSAQPVATRDEKNPAMSLGNLPPVVARTFPVSGSRDVEPGDTELRITFNKEMTDGSWSWVNAWENSVPEMLGVPRFEADRRTCVLKVKLEPGRTYACWLNTEEFRNFKDLSGRAAVPYLLTFATR